MDKGTGSRNKKISVGGKWLGLTTISDSTNLPLGALSSAFNLVTDVGGALRKREGFTVVSDADPELKNKTINDMLEYDAFKITPSLTKQTFYDLNSLSTDLNTRVETQTASDIILHMADTNGVDGFALHPPFQTEIFGVVDRTSNIRFVGNGIGSAYASTVKNDKTIAEATGLIRLGDNKEKFETHFNSTDKTAHNFIKPGQTRIQVPADEDLTDFWNSEQLPDPSGYFSTSVEYGVKGEDENFELRNGTLYHKTDNNISIKLSNSGAKKFGISSFVDKNGSDKNYIIWHVTPRNLHDAFVTAYTIHNLKFEVYFHNGTIVTILEKTIDLTNESIAVNLHHEEITMLDNANNEIHIHLITVGCNCVEVTSINDNFFNPSINIKSSLFNKTMALSYSQGTIGSYTLVEKTEPGYTAHNAYLSGNLWAKSALDFSSNPAYDYLYFLKKKINSSNNLNQLFINKQFEKNPFSNVFPQPSKDPLSYRGKYCYDAYAKPGTNTIIAFDRNYGIRFCFSIEFDTSGSAYKIKSISIPNIGNNEYQWADWQFFSENCKNYKNNVAADIEFKINNNVTQLSTLDTSQKLNYSTLSETNKLYATFKNGIGGFTKFEDTIKNAECQNIYSALMYKIKLTINNKHFSGKYTPWDWLSDFADFHPSGKNIDVKLLITKEFASSRYPNIFLYTSVPFLSNVSGVAIKLHSLDAALTSEEVNANGSMVAKLNPILKITDYTYFDNKLILNTGDDIIAVSFFTNESGQNLLFASSLNAFAKITTTDDLLNVGHNIIDNHQTDRVNNLWNIKRKDQKISSIKLKDNDLGYDTDKIFNVIGAFELKEYKTPPANKTFSSWYETRWTLYDEEGKVVVYTDPNGVKKPLKDLQALDKAGKPTTDESFTVHNEWIDGSQTYSLYVKVKQKTGYDSNGNIIPLPNPENLLDENGNASVHINFKLQNQKVKILDSYAEIKKCKYSAHMNGKLVLYGNDTNQIYTSMINDPFYFYANNVVKADSFNLGEHIVAISDFKDTKIIFTENTMMSMTGDGNYVAGSPWAILGLDATHGTSSHKGVVPIENSLAFVSQDGIYVINQLSVADKRVDLLNLSVNCNDLAAPTSDDLWLSALNMDKNVIALLLEKRLMVYYPTQGYMLVYDYANTSFNEGIWFTWTFGNADKGWILPNFIRIVNNTLVMNDGKWLLFKAPKLRGHISSQQNNTFIEWKNYFNPIAVVESNQYFSPHGWNGFYRDGFKGHFVTQLTTRDSTFGEVDQYKRIKNITINTTNSSMGTGELEVWTTVDSQIDQEFKTNTLEWKNPILEKHSTSFALNQQMTTYRPNDNIYSKTFLKSKNGRTISIGIQDVSEHPLEIKDLSIELMESKAKNKKVR